MRKYIICLLVILFVVPATLFAATSMTNWTSLSDAMQVINNSTAYCWEKWVFENDITTEDTLVLKGISNHNVDLIIDGNNKKLIASGTKNLNEVIDIISRSNSNTINVTIKNLTIEVGEGFRHGIHVERAYQKSGGKNVYYSKGVILVLENVNIISKHETAPVVNDKAKESVLIQNNNSTVTIKGNCTFTTDEFCWAAIDNDDEHGYTKLSFDTSADVNFVDNRDEHTKCIEPLIKFTEAGSNMASPVFNTTMTDLLSTKVTGKTSEKVDYYGYNLKDQHFHGNWEYEIKGNSIVATCGNANCTEPDFKARVSVFAPGKLTLSVVSDKGDVKNDLLSWNSSDDNVATVDANGVVKAVTKGDVEITATSTRGDKVSDKIKLSIKAGQPL